MLVHGLQSFVDVGHAGLLEEVSGHLDLLAFGLAAQVELEAGSRPLNGWNVQGLKMKIVCTRVNNNCLLINTRKCE